MRIYNYTINRNDIQRTDLKPFKRSDDMVIDESEYATQKDVKEQQKRFSPSEKRPYEETLGDVLERMKRALRQEPDDETHV